MQYRLKKDLPWVKAGAEVEALPDNHNYIMVGDMNINPFNDDTYLQKLISDGWIEEVKPREFWVAPFYPDGFREVSSDSSYAGKFKVCEVLE